MSFEKMLEKIVDEALDKVNKDAAMKKFANRKDKDIDNDGDVDDSDEYLHTKRKAITKAVKNEMNESHFEVGDEVECINSGMEGEVVKVDSKEKGKYYTVKREDGKMIKYAPDELKALDESVQLDEADGWIAMYNGKKLEISKSQAKDLYGAKMFAAKQLRVPKSKMGVLAVKPAYNESVKFNGRTFKDYKEFNSEKEANKFLEKNDDYGVIGEKGRKVYVAKMDDMGESVKYFIGEGKKFKGSSADEIRSGMPGFVGMDFAKKAEDDDIIKMAELMDKHSEMTNKMKPIVDEINKLRKKYRLKPKK